MNDIQPPRRPSLRNESSPVNRQRPLVQPPQALGAPTAPVVRTRQDQVNLEPSLPNLETIELSQPQDNNAAVEVKKPRSRWKKWLGGILALLVVLTVIGAVVGYLWYQGNLKAVAPGSNEKIKVTIESGTGPEGIAALLKQNGLIRSESAFEWYVRLERKSGLLQAGAYRLGKGEDVPTIVKHLTSGNTDTFSLTFLPGATLAEHKKVFINAGYGEQEVAAAFAKKYDSPLFAGKPSSADFEGYIYGETYSFGADATAEVILSYIFKYYWDVVEKENLVSLYKEKGLTLYEGITLASIIQREVAGPQDAAQVSQVFQLRLKMDMELGSDVTYQYIADKEGNPRDVNYPSPYNTRRYKGLPPGPISTPGIDSLRAVASPAEGDYVYFLSGDDDKTYFGRTNEEHERNIREHCQKKCQII